MASYEKRTGRWTARWQIAGIRKSKSGFSSKRNAEIYESQQHVRHEKGLLGLPSSDHLEIVEIVDKYLDYAREHKRHRAAARDRNVVHNWQEFFSIHAVVFVSQITPAMVQEYVAWRSHRVMKPFNS